MYASKHTKHLTMLHVHKALTVHLTQKSVANEFVVGNEHHLESFSSNHIINFMCHCDIL